MNPWTAADLLITKPVGGAIEPADVETLRLRARRAAAYNDAVARFQRIGSHSDIRELRAIVHFQPPLLWPPAIIVHVDQDKRMRIDEMELRDGTFNCHLPAAVVDAGERMMGVD